MTPAGRKPKTWHQSWVDRIHAQAWAHQVARIVGVAPTGYALTQFFDPQKPGQSLIDWNNERSHTWDRRLRAKIGMPVESELRRIDKLAPGSHDFAKHVIWRVLRRDWKEHELDDLIRELDPGVSRRLLPTRDRVNYWQDHHQKAYEAARWLGTEGNIDALTSLLIMHRALDPWEPEVADELGYLAFGVFLRAAALDRTEAIAHGQAHLFFHQFDYFELHEHPPDFDYPYFMYCIPDLEKFNVQQAVEENIEIVRVVTRLGLIRNRRADKERFLYFCDRAIRPYLLEAVHRADQNNIRTRMQLDDELLRVLDDFDVGLQAGLINWVSWWYPFR